MSELVGLDELRAACPPGTNLIGPTGPDGTSFTVNNRLVAECRRPDGTRHGPSVIWYANGVRAAAGDYYEGQKEGPWSFWHENGRISGRGMFRQGKPEGRWMTWYDNGQEESEGTYLDGLHHGRFIYWDRHGGISRVLLYDRGNLRK